MTKLEKLNYWQEKFQFADSYYMNNYNEKVIRRQERYDGTSKVYMDNGSVSKVKAPAVSNITFEMIEAQINNGVPAPKVTARDAKNRDLAQKIEHYLKYEMDRMDSELFNDMSERNTLIQGTSFFLVGWDNSKSTPLSEGELFIQEYAIDRVRPQPDVTDIKKMEYIFFIDKVSRRKLSMLYNKPLKDIPKDPENEDLTDLITCYYFNDKNKLSRYGWIKDTDYVIFDEENYMFRKFRICKYCATRTTAEVCPVCGSTSFEYESNDKEILEEDLVAVLDPQKPRKKTILVKKGDKINYYEFNELPVVVRYNISKKDSFYGVSDADLLEEVQATMNKITTKITENQLKAGSIITKPRNVHIKNTDQTLKIVDVSNPKDVEMIHAINMQANTQQDDIWGIRLYEYGRRSLGITDSYQGKRDPTAESGKAKEVAAAQANGRLESKRRMKDAAFARLYELMFKLLLAFCDEPRDFILENVEGQITRGKFNRYEFLEKNMDTDKVYYNDRYLFSVDNASILSTNREMMWRETTGNFQSGTFGNPADPNTLMLYWNVMRELGYPLADKALENIRNRTQQLPQELQQVIMQNPDILNAVKQVLQQKEGSDVQNSQR
ncbi:MAG: hypothetical protein RBR02_06325 [Desulfuromonadaceae bacterium]|nr:hypothetical protein [Desulfuromonadaceae bacterium]